MGAVSMSGVVYVFVDDAGEPNVWGPAGEANVSVFGDFWRARRDPGAKTFHIRALSQEDLKELLRGRWEHITHVVYHPAADGYQVSRETILERAQ